MGRAVHAALRDWQRRVDGGRASLAAELTATVMRRARGLRLDPAQLERALSALEPGLVAYAEGPWPRRKTLALEHTTRYRLVGPDGFAVDLILRADRVVHDRRGTAILDFKTVPPHPFQLRVDDWQLRTYALALPEVLGVRARATELFIISIRDASVIAVDSSPSALTAAREELLQCARGVAARDFALGNGHDDRPCWCCGFRLGCPSSLAPGPPSVARH
jgi:hypothetical protein